MGLEFLAGVGLNSSLSRCGSLLRSSGLCCCSAVWCGSGRPTHCTNNMSVGKLGFNDTLFFSSHVKVKETALFRSFPQQGDALGGNSALAPGHLLQFPQSLLPIPDQRRSSGFRVQLPRVCVSPIRVVVIAKKKKKKKLPRAQVGVGVSGWRGFTPMPKNSCSMTLRSSSSAASGTMCRLSRTSWKPYASARM